MTMGTYGYINVHMGTFVIEPEQIVNDDVHMRLEALGSPDPSPKGVGPLVEFQVLISGEEMQVDVRRVHGHSVGEVASAYDVAPSTPSLVVEEGDSVCSLHERNVAWVLVYLGVVGDLIPVPS